MIRRLVSLVALLAIGGLIVALLMPPSDAKVDTLPEEEMAKAKTSAEELIAAARGNTRRKRFVFSPAAATAGYNQAFIAAVEEAEGAGTYVIQEAVFLAAPEGELRVVLKTKLMNMVPIQFEVVGAVVPGAGGEEPRMDIRSARMGRVKFPAALVDKIVDKYTPLIEDGNERAVISALKNFEIDDDGNFRVELK